jgi:hypothetical protein
MAKPKYRIGRDIDLDDEVVLLANGERLTETLAEQMGEELAAEFARRRRGRPSLSGNAEETPQIAARVPVEVRDKLEARAAAEGKKLSEVVRDALAAYVA